MSRRGAAMFIALAVVWGIPYFFIKIVVQEVSPSQLVFLRCGLAALIMLPLAWRDGSIVLALRKWRWVLAFAAFEFIGPWYLLAAAEQRITSSLAGLLLAAVPLFSTMLGRFLGDHSATHWRRLLGLFVGFAGVGLLVGIDGINGSIDYAAVTMMLFVSMGYAIAPQISARKLQGVSTMGVVGLSMPMVSAFYAIPALASWPAAGISNKAWGSLLFLAVVCTVIAFEIFFRLIALLGPVRASLVTYLNPVVAIALGVAAAGDTITRGMLLGFPLVLLGSFFAARPPRPVAQAALAES
ncbi:MAG: DMT family transporter [Candidatus Nanopelagicales bacterium]